MVRRRVQVYKGVLRGSGRDVAVKVQRPSIADNMAIDMLLLRRLMAVVDANITSFIDVSHCFAALKTICTFRYENLLV